MEQQGFADGGVQTVLEIAVQYVYLDFDGALTSYNGEILTVDDVEVQDSSLTEDRILKIIAELNKKYAAQNVVFVSERPQTDEYSTIFVGKTSAFDEYGNFVGLAETIDSGNKNKKDNAFVMLDSSDSDEQIISTISHETDHLLGTLDHGGDGLEAYAADYYVNSGEILTGVVLEWGDYMTISNGGVASNTTVNSGGGMYISSGGVANNTTISSGASTYIKGYGDYNLPSHMSITSGGIANNTTVSSGGGMYIVGGRAFNTTVSSGGSMYIVGGSAIGVNVLSGAALTFTVASDTYVQGTVNGSAFEMKDAYISGYSLEGGSMFIYSGGVANNTTISGGFMYIASGGMANNTTVSSGGYMTIITGGSATGINVLSEAALTFTVASDTYVQGTVNGSAFEMKDAYISGYSLEGGSMFITSGGMAVNTTVSSGGYMYIASGGMAMNVDWTPCEGYVTVEDGAYVTYTSQYSGVYYGSNHKLLSNAATMNNITVSGNAEMWVMQNGVASNTIINGSWRGGVVSGCMYITDGVAVNTTVNSGCMYITDGVAVNTTVNSGYMYITRGGVAKHTVLNQGSLYIYSGGVHSGIMFFADNTVHASAYAGAVIDFTVSGRNVSDGYLINDISLIDGTPTYTITVSAAQAEGTYKLARGAYNLNGAITVKNDAGTVLGTVTTESPLYCGSRAYVLTRENGNLDFSVVNREVIIVSGGNTVNNKSVNRCGSMYITGGGTALNTTVNSGGSMVISSGGAAKHTVLNQGSLYISSGGVHRGVMFFADNTVHASAYAGAVIDFTVSERTIYDDYLINDVSLVDGAPTYTITVSADQANGTYKLARGAYNLNGAITIGDETTAFGTITINGSDLSCDGSIYSLDCVNGDLTLTVIRLEAGGNSDGVYWENIPGDEYTVEFSNDGFSDVLQVETSGNSLDIYGMPSGTYQYRVQDENGRYTYGEDIVAEQPAGPQELASDANGNMDLFFARASGKWKNSYMAQHQGVLNGWEGTGELTELSGRNKLADIFEGSSDANVLVMTDDENGDALFVDDVYTSLGDQARLSQIDEIRAGLGDDIVDMTSQQFSYIGDGVTIYGGSGDDVIWANNGNNILFGDAGRDRIVGGSGNDVVIGGSGDDSMHGGGGNDTFTFGGNWGYDTVEQLNGGEVTLRFESGDESNWNASTLTYSDGINSVQVIGVSSEDVTLKFGGDVSSLPSGCFEDAASEKIFEDYNKGMIA